MSFVQCLRRAAPTERGVIHVDVRVLRTRRRRSGRPRGCYVRGLSNTECHPPCIPIGKTCTYGKQLGPSSCGEKFRDAVRAHVSEVEHTHHRQFPPGERTCREEPWHSSGSPNQENAAESDRQLRSREPISGKRIVCRNTIAVLRGRSAKPEDYHGRRPTARELREIF